MILVDFGVFFKMLTDIRTDRQMDRWMDRHTDIWTDIPSYRDARAHLKIAEVDYSTVP